MSQANYLVSGLAQPEPVLCESAGAWPAACLCPGLHQPQEPGQQPLSLSPSRTHPPSLSPAAPWPASPWVMPGLGSGVGEACIVADHCGSAGGESKDFLAWSKSFPSPPAERFGAEDGLFPMGFEPGASGCPCTELLLNVPASTDLGRFA